MFKYKFKGTINNCYGLQKADEFVDLKTIIMVKCMFNKCSVHIREVECVCVTMMWMDIMSV